MVARIVGAALARRHVVFLIAGLFVAGSLYALRATRLDAFPEFAPPIVDIQAEAPGLAADDVEALVTTPIERALAGTPDLVTVRSDSTPGLAVVAAVFPYGADPYRVRQLVIERLALAADQLPRGVKPAVAPLASALTTILAIGMRGDAGVSPLELRDLAEWAVRPRLLAVPGVANVVVYGGQVRQVQVTTTPERLWAADVTLDDLVAATEAADAPAGSGFLDRAGQRLPTWLDGRLRDAASLGRTPLPGRDGTPLPLAAAADVAEGPAVAVGDATVNGDPGVVLVVTRQPGVDVVGVTAAVEAALGALLPALPRGVRVDPAMFRQASFVEHAIGNLRRALVASAVLVVLVLLLFLGRARTAFISVVAIPLSLLAAMAVLWASGASLNIMALAGLAIAVGEVVDDAIIDVENAWRRLRETPGGGAHDVVLAASVEVRSAVVYATFIVVLVFVPVFLLGGIEGALFRPLATAYVLATLASLVVALTVTPALALALLPGAMAGNAAPPRLATALRGRYARALTWALAHSRGVIGSAALVLVGGIALTPFLRLEFLPEFHETNFVMHMTGAPGIGLEESARVGEAAARALLAVPGVRSVAQLIGRSTLSEDPWGAERSELMIRLEAEENAAGVTREIRDRATAVTGFAFDLKQFLNERIEELIAGTGAALVVRLRGADLESLEHATELVQARLSTVPGVVDVRASSVLPAPGVRIVPRREDLLRFGMPARSVEQVLRSALGGIVVGRIVRADWQADVVVRLESAAAGDAARLTRLPLVRRGGRVLSLGSVADVDLAPLRTVVSHEDGVRTVVVRLDARGRPLEEVAQGVARSLEGLALGPGVYIELGGEYAEARAARRRLLGLGALALAGVFVLLLLDFGSMGLAALTMVNLPLAFAGGLAAVLLGAQGRLSLGAIVGFVTVFGITMRNGIMLVAHFQHVGRDAAAPLEGERLVAAAADRLAPILMTALVTGIALLPLLALGGRAGGEIEQPMALVILGGLVSSTGLNLFVLPLWYARTARSYQPST